MQAENVFDAKNPIGGKISKIVDFITQADEVITDINPTFRVFLKAFEFCQNHIPQMMCDLDVTCVEQLKSRDCV